MKDLNKERELYEVWAFNNIENFIDVERDGMYYVMKQGSRLRQRDKEFLVLSSNRGWAAWQEKSKFQAVPEGYVLVPKEIPDSVVSYLENSRFNWGDGTRDHYMPIYSLMVEVASESGDEG